MDPVDAFAVDSVSSSIPTNKDMFAATSSMANNLLSMMWSKNMYKRQRKDALEFWNMQNEYNSPVAQMARFKAAGLNPNLIYGQGNSGNAQAISVPDTQSVNFREPQIEGAHTNALQSLMAVADLRIKAAQADNLDAQNEVIKNQALLTSWQAQRTEFDLGMERSLSDVSADARREQLRKLQIDNQVTMNRDIREAALNASNVNEAAERILSMQDQRLSNAQNREQSRAEVARIKENISNMQKEGILKDFDIALRSQGIMPGDPLWARYTGMFLSDVADGKVTPSTIAGSAWGFLVDWKNKKDSEALKFVKRKQ